VPRYRIVLSACLLAIGIALAVLGLFAQSGAARVNTWTAAGACIVWALIVRFQHVRF